MSLFVILILITSEVGLVLAQFGHFSTISLSILVCSFLGMALVAGRSRLKPSFRPGRETLLLLPVVAVAGILFSQPYQYMDGGWDPGAYVNTGVHIGRTGSVLYHDELLTEMSEPERQMLCGLIRNNGTGIKYPGLYVKDLDRGLIVPQFFLLYPTWIAIFYKLAGLKAVFYVNSFFALCSVVLMFCIGQRIGRGYGLLSALLLAVNVIQIWNARFSTSEILAQFFLLSGIYFWMQYMDSKNGFSAFWAGLAVGEFLLTSVTSLLIIPVVIIYLVFRANKRDVYFILPFFLILAQLIVQLHIFSSIYFESVIAFFRHREMYLGIGMFLLALSSVSFLKKIHGRYFRFSVASVTVGVFTYGYLIRPHVASSIEALNLVELGRYLSAPGLVLAVAGLVLVTCREKREGILFFAMTALIMAAFFIYNKRMFSRYPFALRRYVPALIPAYCFCISYFCSFLNRYRPGRLLSVLAVLLVTAIPIKNCRDIISARDYHGSLSVWRELAEHMGDDAVYISNRYRWARPLTDIFGKQVIAFTGTSPFDGEKVAGFARKLIGDGKRVYYLSNLPKPYSLSVDFADVYKKCLETEYLEHSLTFPPKKKPLNLCFKVFRVIPIEESTLQDDKYTVDVGADSIGLLSGFDKARRFSGAPGYARWTLARAELVIPWLGDNAAQTLTVFGSGMPEEAGCTSISIYVEGFPVSENYPVGANLREHEFLIPPDRVRTGDKKRAVLTIESSTWNPDEHGIKGYPNQLGMKIYWIRIALQ